MHDSVSAKDEGVRVHLSNDAGGSRADVCHDAGACGSSADSLEVRGVQGWMCDFIDGGVEDRAGGAAGAGGGGGE